MYALNVHTRDVQANDKNIRNRSLIEFEVRQVKSECTQEHFKLALQ
jgi:hypothetical protein